MAKAAYSARPALLPSFLVAAPSLLLGLDMANYIVLLDVERGLLFAEALELLFWTASACVAAAFCAFFADKWLRLPVERAGIILVAAGSFTQLWTPDLMSANVLVPRFLGAAFIGSGIGILTCTVPVHLAESAPRRCRGRVLSLEGIVLAAGFFVAGVVEIVLRYTFRGVMPDNLVPADGATLSPTDPLDPADPRVRFWSYSVQGAIALFVLPVTFFAPESAHALAVRGLRGPARKSLEMVLGGGASSDAVLKPPPAELVNEELTSLLLAAEAEPCCVPLREAPRAHSLSLLVRLGLRRRTLVAEVSRASVKRRLISAIALALPLAFCGYPYVMLSANALYFDSTHKTFRPQGFFVLAVALVVFLSSIQNYFTIDGKSGRIGNFMQCLVAMTLCQLVLMVLALFEETMVISNAGTVLTVFLYLIYTVHLFFYFSADTLVRTYHAEIFPAKSRLLCHSLAKLAQLLCFYFALFSARWAYVFSDHSASVSGLIASVVLLFVVRTLGAMKETARVDARMIEALFVNSNGLI